LPDTQTHQAITIDHSRKKVNSIVNESELFHPLIFSQIQNWFFFFFRVLNCTLFFDVEMIMMCVTAFETRYAERVRVFSRASEASALCIGCGVVAKFPLE